MNYKAPRGTHDLWGDKVNKLNHLNTICRKIFVKHNFSEVVTPTFEDAKLFSRSIGETTDIVEKEMYVFQDRKGRNLALRPEGTASLVRAYIENHLSQSDPIGKYFYIGPMYRYERPQAGRYREFFQVGAEYFGNNEPAADAETIILSSEIFNAFGVTDAKIYLNTLGCSNCRPKFREAIKKYFATVKDLCDDCKRRIEKNPLRILDCKVDADKFNNLPKMEDFLDKGCKEHFDKVQELLKGAGCEFVVDHKLVRGLDYYTRTVFEIRSKSVGSQDALAAGGRYDNLVRELGGAATPSIGFALGSERVIMAAENLKILGNLEKPKVIFVAVSSKDLENQAFSFVSKLRAKTSKSKFMESIGQIDNISIEGPFADKSLKNQLRLSDKIKSVKTIIFGEEEFKKGLVVVKDMASQKQEEIAIDKILS
ncbi:histidine--tRNA ligase [Elusimicrobiota bacterium]